MHLHQQPANPRFQTSMPGMSATKARKAFGPKSELHGRIATARGFRSSWILFRSTVALFFAGLWNHPSRERARERPPHPAVAGHSHHDRSQAGIFYRHRSSGNHQRRISPASHYRNRLSVTFHAVWHSRKSQ